MQPRPIPGLLDLPLQLFLFAYLRGRLRVRTQIYFAFELVALNCIKCIMGGNLYAALQKYNVSVCHVDCMHSRKLMEWVLTFWLGGGTS